MKARRGASHLHAHPARAFGAAACALAVLLALALAYGGGGVEHSSPSALSPLSLEALSREGGLAQLIVGTRFSFFRGICHHCPLGARFKNKNRVLVFFSLSRTQGTMVTESSIPIPRERTA